MHDGRSGNYEWLNKIVSATKDKNMFMDNRIKIITIFLMKNELGTKLIVPGFYTCK